MEERNSRSSPRFSVIKSDSIVIEPKVDRHVRFDPDQNSSIDDANGYRLWIALGYRESPHTFLLRNASGTPVVEGKYELANEGGYYIINIVQASLRTSKGRERISSDSYDLSTVANHMTVWTKGKFPNQQAPIIVVDNRQHHLQRRGSAT